MKIAILAQFSSKFNTILKKNLLQFSGVYILNHMLSIKWCWSWVKPHLDFKVMVFIQHHITRKWYKMSPAYSGWLKRT